MFELTVRKNVTMILFLASDVSHAPPSHSWTAAGVASPASRHPDSAPADKSVNWLS